MKTEQPLAVIGASTFSVTITPDAEQRKADALELARAIKTVTTPAEQQDAIAAAALLKGLIKAMDATHKEVKRPIIDAWNECDDVKKLYCGSIEKDLKRLESLAAAYQSEQQRKADIIRQEQERLNREAEEAAVAERRVYLAIIVKASTDAEREAAQRAADAAAEANAEAARARQQQMLAIAAPKLAGASVRQVVDFEVLDIWELAKARPDLVTIEPKVGLIRAVLTIPGASLPGIRATAGTKVLARASL